MFAIILLAATVSNVIERFGQPPVVGQLLAGIVLSALGYFGWGLMQEAATNTILAFLASFGAVILLLSAGVESKVRSLAKVGASALAVALIGVTVPFLSGVYWLGPWLFPDQNEIAYWFLGAALVATSVGISVAIFRALDIVRTRAAQTVLAAAIFDDILGLVILAVMSELAITGNIGVNAVSLMVVKSVGFLFGSLVIGQVSAQAVSKLFSKLNHNATSKLVLAVTLALVLGYVAELVGLQPIIGAFAAGLLLTGMAFQDYEESDVVEDLLYLRNDSDSVDRPKINRLIGKHRRAHLGGMIDTLGAVSVPVFFVFTGLQINFGSLLDPEVYAAAIIVSAVAVVGKVVAGLAARGRMREKLVVGISMVPRGEVGLIFAATAKALGVFDESMYSVVLLTIVITTFVAPPVLMRLIGVHEGLGSRAARLLGGLFGRPIES